MTFEEINQYIEEIIKKFSHHITTLQAFLETLPKHENTDQKRYSTQQRITSCQEGLKKLRENSTEANLAQNNSQQLDSIAEKTSALKEAIETKDQHLANQSTELNIFYDSAFPQTDISITPENENPNRFYYNRTPSPCRELFEQGPFRAEPTSYYDSNRKIISV